MSTETELRSPQIIADELAISPATLRRWSDEFTSYLSEGAGTKKDKRTHQRYTDSDVATLSIIKSLMSNGMTYEGVRQQLNGNGETPDILREDQEQASPIVNDSDTGESTDLSYEEHTLVSTENAESPAVAFLTNTLTTLSDSQKSILNSQSANRELLGVLLQDNFNLKEENNRLRERVLDVERGVAQNKQDEEWRREALRQELEAKISTANQLATQALTTAHSVEAPEIKAIESKSGCLGMLFGGGGTKIISTRRRKTDGPGQDQSQQMAGPGSATPPALPEQSPANYPKPMFPPE